MDFHRRPAIPFHAPQWRQLCRLLAACALGWGAAALLGVAEGYWALITAVTVMQPDLSHTLAAGRDRIVATCIGALCGVALIALREAGLPGLPLFVAGLVPLAMIIAVWPNLRLACATLVVVFLIPAGGNPYARPLARVADILLGVVACLAVSVLVFPDENPKPR